MSRCISSKYFRRFSILCISPWHPSVPPGTTHPSNATHAGRQKRCHASYRRNHKLKHLFALIFVDKSRSYVKLKFGTLAYISYYIWKFWLFIMDFIFWFQDNYSPLHLGVEAGKSAGVECLLGHGAKVHIKGKQA